MGRPRGVVPAEQAHLRAASRRTGRDGVPIIRLSSDRCLSGMGAHAGHPAPVRRSALRIPPGRVMSDHLASFALRTAFPPSSAGRDSGDYYEASVAIGLASRRRSRVRPCHTSQRDVGGHSSPSTPSLGVAPCSGGCVGHQRLRRRTRHRFQWSFRRMRTCIDWRLGFRQFSFRRITRVPPTRRP